MTRRAAVMGAGAWGTAFAKVLVDSGTSTVLWSRRPEIAETIQAKRCNPDYLPDVRLPDVLDVTADPEQALRDADFVVIAVPSQTLRKNLSGWTSWLPPQALLVSLMKGIEAGSCQRMTEVMREVADVDETAVAAVSGPNLASEIAAEQPAATVVACVDEEAAGRFQGASATRYLRPYTNRDVIGCELGGSVKNIIAILVGMAEGMGFGDNTRASVITRGLAETTRLGVTLGADPLTFSGLAGLGDLVATCASPLSRNRSFGERLSRGCNLEQMLEHPKHVVEGVESSRAVLALAQKHGVDMPIAEHVVRAVSGEMSPTEVLHSLMARRRTSERPIS